MTGAQRDHPVGVVVAALAHEPEVVQLRPKGDPADLAAPLRLFEQKSSHRLRNGNSNAIDRTVGPANPHVRIALRALGEGRGNLVSLLADAFQKRRSVEPDFHLQAKGPPGRAGIVESIGSYFRINANALLTTAY